MKEKVFLCLNFRELLCGREHPTENGVPRSSRSTGHNSSGDNKGMVRRGGNVRQIQELKLGFQTISPWLRGRNATSAHHPPWGQCQAGEAVSSGRISQVTS